MCMRFGMPFRGAWAASARAHVVEPGRSRDVWLSDCVLPLCDDPPMLALQPGEEGGRKKKKARRDADGDEAMADGSDQGEADEDEEEDEDEVGRAAHAATP